MEIRGGDLSGMNLPEHTSFQMELGNGMDLVSAPDGWMDKYLENWELIG